MPKSRILVIDDEAAIRDSLRMTLEYEGYDVLVAATGQEGLALAERVRHPRGKKLSGPTALLFNGGVFKADPLRARVNAILDDWGRGGSGPVKVLENKDMDRAVSRGAAYYGLVRRGKGVRIRGGAARVYYVGVETSLPAVPGSPPPMRRGTAITPHSPR